ncbi:MAG TPA: error-prone DNA polymerase [Chthoniobacterales bacterium]
MKYVELHARSAFSFLRGAAAPEDLAKVAAALGLAGVTLCDRDGVYGAPRLHAEAGEQGGLTARVGAELTMEDGSVLPVLVATRTGYRNLCQLLTRAKLRGTKKQSAVRWGELPEFAEGLIALTGDEEGAVVRCVDAEDFAGARGVAERLVAAFGRENVTVELQRHLVRGEETRLDALDDLAAALRLPTVATGGVLYAVPAQREVLDVFTCTRHHTQLDAAGRLLDRNAERFLRTGAEMAALFADRPAALANAARLADRLTFSLENLGYEFPRFRNLGDAEMQAVLREQSYAGLRRRYRTITPKIRETLEKELALIIELGFAGYFLIVWDIVEHCRRSGILVQGRGSAANSVVCYALGITACDPIECRLLFERFLAPPVAGQTKISWPDIDLDLPSGDRRESVIQEVYRRYGEHGAAMTANVITFRGKSAMREIGKALSFPPEMLDRFSDLYANGDFPQTLDFREQLRMAGLPEDNARVAAALRLRQGIHGLPRHLGQHSGGMIICQNALSSVMPLERASMPGRVVAQWDKNDCDDLGIIKVDLLGLGMMSVMQDSFALAKARRQDDYDFYNLPAEDPKTYAMLGEADTIGLFQVESRAQMATLPRLRPKNFYDIAIQIAIIRPGPIEGGMMHPYLARRNGREKVEYFGVDPASELGRELVPMLERTLGVPLFQEQMLAMAIKLAGFTGREIAELKKALSFHRSHEKMNRICDKLRTALAERRIAPEVADRIEKSVRSFAVYGFPESHALSFAYIAYASAWMKAHRAPEFYASLLNNQPMGFYSASTLVYDAKAHGVRVRPVCVTESDERCTVVDDATIRLGLNMVRGISANEVRRILEERTTAPFASVEDFKRRVRLAKDSARGLARLGALNGLGGHRRETLWRVEAPARTGDLFADAEAGPAPLEMMNAFERMQADYAGSGVTTGPHPMALVRDALPHVWRAADLREAANGTRVTIAGLVICRQRPGTAQGFVFVSLEDETGVANAVVTPALFEARRLTITQERFLEIRGVVQNVDRVIHVKAARIEAFHPPVAATPDSHDFH